MTLAYTLRDGYSGIETEIQARDAADARRQARDWARQGDYCTDYGTIYVDVYVVDEDGEEERVTVPIPQNEPRCVSAGVDHDWKSPYEVVGGIRENPGVWGHGGGVVINEACMLCGCRRLTDTWATRRDTGEQGLKEVTYERDVYTHVLARREEDA